MTVETPSGASLLDVEALSVEFESPAGRVQAVCGVSFSVGKGEVVGIVGESGSGKSVTCRSILGLLPRTATVRGQIKFDEHDLLQLGREELQRVRGRKIGMIFQNPGSHLDPLMRIGGQIGESLRHHLAYRPSQARAHAIGVLGDVGITDPDRRVDAYPHELSGGMKQRAMTAGAIACAPQLLIADEPTTALDVTVQARILELLMELNRSGGLAILLISHDLGVIAEICQRVIVMRHGRIVEEGRTQDVIHRPHHDYTKLLIDSQPVHRMEQTVVPEGGPVATELLRVQSVSMEFAVGQSLLAFSRGSKSPRFRAVDSVSFEVAVGETVGIVGESGSGKSTLARVIARLLTPVAGRVLYRGTDVHTVTGPERAAVRRAMQMVFQSPLDSLNPRFSVGEAIAEPLIRHRLVDPREMNARVRELMDMVELPSSLKDRRPQQISGGQCQRVALARALAMRPELLIADEITSALDVTTQAQILDLLSRLRRDARLTILYISHDLAVVRTFCQRVLVFKQGRVVEFGPVKEVMVHPKHEYTKLLIASIPRLNTTAEYASRRREHA